MSASIILRVTRYRPGQDKKPTLQSYVVPYRKDWVVLDALNDIKDYVDGTVSSAGRVEWVCAAVAV